jgi:hypothetical protein
VSGTYFRGVCQTYWPEDASRLAAAVSRSGGTRMIKLNDLIKKVQAFKPEISRKEISGVYHKIKNTSWMESCIEKMVRQLNTMMAPNGGI